MLRVRTRFTISTRIKPNKDGIDRATEKFQQILGQLDLADDIYFSKDPKIKRMPIQTKDLDIETYYLIWEGNGSIDAMKRFILKWNEKDKDKYRNWILSLDNGWALL